MSPTLPQKVQGSSAQEPSEPPPASEESSKNVTETQPKYNEETSFDHRDVSFCPPPFDEIRFLQDRLSYLEGQAAQQSKVTVEDAPPEDNNDDQMEKNSELDDEKTLRKHIQKAPGGRQWVEKIEQHAEETAEERKDYGQEPSRSAVGHAQRTIHHVQKNGELFQCPEFDAIYGNGRWLRTHGHDSVGTQNEDVRIRSGMNPDPRRGVRPPATLHPFYATPARGMNTDGKHPLRLSRKLGPPTRWDESDFEEWSSDTSTGSQDFKYFRSRLRGDFEWELDRLNAQVRRFQKHRDRKRSRQLAIQAQKDKETRKEALGAYEKDGALLADLKLGAAGAGRDENGIQQFISLGWSDFRLRGALPLEYCFVIDVLIEEPKLSSGLKSSWRVKKDKQALKKDDNTIIPAANDLDSKDDMLHGLKQPTPWTAQDPLPERIRINSKQVIDVLSSIHGSPLSPNTNESSSVVLLRPFKILDAYGKQIRERCSRLEEGCAKGPEMPPTMREQGETKQPDSAVAPDEETSDQPSDVKDNRAVEEKEKPTSQEEQSLQLQHLSCLCEFMDEFIGRKLAFLNSANCTKISFSDVWHLYQPGTTVISADGKQAYRIVSLQSKRHKGVDRWDAFWTRQYEKGGRDTDSSDESEYDARAEITIKCVFIHFDGESFGPVIRKFHINKWDGDKEVTYLDIYPIRFHILKHIDKRSVTSNTKTPISLREEEVEKGVRVLRQKLIDRGRVFLDVAAVKQMYYSGLAVDTRDEIESQVMVDFEEALAHEARKDWVPKITRLVGNDWNSKTDEAVEGCTAECCRHENVHDDAYVEANNTEKVIDDMMAEIEDIPHKLPSAIIYPRTLEETKTESNALTDEELMIMSYSVFGFVLRDRTWGKCSQRRNCSYCVSQWNGLTHNLHPVAKLDLDCMSDVRAPGNATEPTDDDLEEGGQGAFGQLVLPAGHKKMVLSLISQHFRNKESQEGNDKQVDIVRGKGTLYQTDPQVTHRLYPNFPYLPSR